MCKSLLDSDHRKRSTRLRLSWTIPRHPLQLESPPQTRCLIVAIEPTQPISQTLTQIDPNTMSDAELAAIVRNGIQADARPH